jgi:hypothetical protein
MFSRFNRWLSISAASDLVIFVVGEAIVALILLQLIVGWAP